MNGMIRKVVGLLPALAVAVTLALPGAASAQSQLNTSEAQAFLGNWTVNFQSDMGPLAVGLNITDASGKVAARVTSDMGNLDVTNITRSGDNLVMSYSMEAQGAEIPVAVTLTPTAEGIRASMDFAGGAFMVTGTGTRAPN